MRDRSDIDPLRAAIAERAGELAETLLGPPSWRGRGELRWGRRGSLSVATAGRRAGLWHDHETGEGGDLLALYQRERRATFPEALEWARGAIGTPAATTPAPRRGGRQRPSVSQGGADTGALAARLWAEAAPARGTIVETYLAARGLHLPEAPYDPDAIRFHPACPRGAERLPAMVTLMTDPASAEPTGVHRTFLRPDGSDRLRDDRAKAMLGRRGVIRLSPDPEVTFGLAIGEGIETCLAASQTLDWRPVWAATCAGAVAVFPILTGIEAITIFADADDAGRHAAEACARRWAEAGREAFILTPRAGDWNDAITREVRP